MKVNQQLLEKYWNNACSSEEIEAVEKWLSSTEEENIDLANATLDTAENKVWHQLAVEVRGNKQEVKYLKLPGFIRYVAAACLVMSLGYVGIQAYNQVWTGQGMTFDNTSASTVKQVQTAGIDFTLLQDSKVEFVNYLGGTGNKINFSGYIKIVKKTDTDATFRFQSENSQRKVRLKKDEIYYVFAQKDKEGNEKIHILDKSNLMLFSHPELIENFVLI